MRRLVRFALGAVAAASLTACVKLEDAQGFVDRAMFRQIGGTMFSTPDLISMKEIHLETVATKGKELILEGQVADVGQHGTYMVLRDENARMLVVLTDIVDAADIVKRDAHQTMKVWGTLETGKKGLPYLMAKSLTVVPVSGGETGAAAGSGKS